MARRDGGRSKGINWGPFFRMIILPILLALVVVAGIVILFCEVPQVGEFFASLWSSIASFFASLWEGLCSIFTPDPEKASASQDKSIFAFLTDTLKDMNEAQMIFLCGFSIFGLFNLFRALFIRWKRLKNLFMFITAVLYGSVFFGTLGGTLFLNSGWMYVLASLCVILMVLTAILFGQKSFSEGITHVFCQLFISVPAWIVFKWLHRISDEGENAIPWLSVLQFAVFAVAFIFQIVAFYLDDIDFGSSGGGGSYRNPDDNLIGGMTGDEDCMDVSDM